MNWQTPKFAEALAYAAEIHREQLRKRPKSSMAIDVAIPVPYLGHLLGVSSIVVDAGGTQDEAIAALLHDAAEDQGGEARLADIAARFGSTVATIVEGCSDSLSADPHHKAPSRERKTRYIAHLAASTDASVYLVSAADKCQNARATSRDLAFAAQAIDVWSMFTAPPASTLWYFDQLIEVYDRGPIDGRRDLIVSDLRIAVAEMRHFAPDDSVEGDETPF